MYRAKVRYLVPTVGGVFREHQLEISGANEYRAFLEQSDRLGYEVIINPMCSDCMGVECACEGSKNHYYTFCNNKYVEGERE